MSNIVFLSQLQKYSTYFFFSSLFVIPQAYFELRLTCLIFFIFANVICIYRKKELIVNAEDIKYYSYIIGIGIFWIFIGLFNSDVIEEGIIAQFKLYVYWSILFLIILTLFRNNSSTIDIHKIVITSILLISLLNIVGLFDYYYDLKIFSLDFKKQMELDIGENRYSILRINSNNISSLFFLIGYLIGYIASNRKLKLLTIEVFALMIGLITAILAGRRALWLVILFMPILVLLIIYAKGLNKLYWDRIKLIFKFSWLILILILILVYVNYEFFNEKIIEFINEGFDGDIRVIQRKILVEGFIDNPLYGVGHAVPLFNYSSGDKWLVESTYHQILYNYGLLGCLLIIIIFYSYLKKALDNINILHSNYSINFGIVVGFLSLLIAAYSNPYIQFDGLIVVLFFIYLANE